MLRRLQDGVDCSTIIDQVLQYVEIQKIIHSLELGLMTEVEITEFKGNQITLKLKGKHGLSIGNVFSFIEELIERGTCYFNEYTAEQTTLE